MFMSINAIHPPAPGKPSAPGGPTIPDPPVSAVCTHPGGTWQSAAASGVVDPAAWTCPTHVLDSANKPLKSTCAGPTLWSCYSRGTGSPG